MEYVVELIAVDQDGNYLGGDYPYCRSCCGTDEYDALTNFVREYIGEINEDDFKINIHLSKVSPSIGANENSKNKIQLFEKFSSGEELSDYIANILKTFGFRIIKNDSNYIVRIPSFYMTDTIIEYFDYRQVYIFDSLDLILLWKNNITKWTSIKDREYYGIKNDDLVILDDLIYNYNFSKYLY